MPKPSGTARIKVEEAEPAGDVFSRPQVTVEEKEGPSTLSRKPVSAPPDENKAPSDTDQAKRELAKAETDQIPGAEPATAPQPESAGELPAQSKILATIAVIASLVLVYALAAQTVAAGMKLPFPGTIGG